MRKGKNRIGQNIIKNIKRNISMENRVPNYLRVENMEWKRGDEIRALFKLRCDNLEEKNKYWLGIEEGECLFCGESEDNLIILKNARKQEF